MIWFKLKKLENRIADNNFTQKEGVSYLIGFVVITFFFAFPKHTVSWAPLIELNLIISSLILIILIKSLFAIHNTIRNDGFLGKFLALSWVIGFRITIFALIPIVLFGIDMAENKLQMTKNEEIIFISINCVMNLLFSYLMIRSFKRVNDMVINRWKNTIFTPDQLKVFDSTFQFNEPAPIDKDKATKIDSVKIYPNFSMGNINFSFNVVSLETPFHRVRLKAVITDENNVPLAAITKKIYASSSIFFDLKEFDLPQEKTYRMYFQIFSRQQNELLYQSYGSLIS